ncbi:glycoside hydrolase family 37 protein [Calocera viscosa TUFC12733]|uniref:Trehalase n=1 Tax=Calocera viscosa (strain TUFC12733) TaxID=1330018 RepID=A0A167HEU7_CALVF|nr:glycoside hydrolase family 37 protein [Calocera viscosa TUFC12733]
MTTVRPTPSQIIYYDDPEASAHIPAVNADPATYYGGQSVNISTRSRTYSSAGLTNRRQAADSGKRRMSHDEKQTGGRKFLIDVEDTIRLILEQEDTDGDFQISITDSGPKVLTLGTATSNGYKSFDVRGTYMLSNLLQELALARDHGRKRIVLDEARLTENPVDRLSRMIRFSFWHALTRRIDGDGLEIICADPKNRTRNIAPLIYVPHGLPEMADYYRKVAREKPHLGLRVEVLPQNCDDPAYVKSLNDKPGILALAMRDAVDEQGNKTLKGIPFVVPGARFNELYNWDSYFISLGLLVDGMLEMAQGMVEHFCFEIKHYGKVLNGSRSYYLCRTQPPFLTDMALQIYNQSEKTPERKLWLKRAIQAAIKDYHTIWMAEPRLDPVTGLSRYRPAGSGIPPETEASHFTHILEPYAHKHGISILEFSEKYNSGELSEPELDEYFLHDRAVRESGHDTTYRFEKRCANLATIDLNSLLYKYEVDIGSAILEVFDDELEIDDAFPLTPFPPSPQSYAVPISKWPMSTSRLQSSDEWFRRADLRKERIDQYLWNEGKKMYFDYDTVQKKQSLYETVTAFWALWAGCASEDQAWELVQYALPKFEVLGGLVSGTEESRGRISLDRPNRQWDYPYAWPPHQIMAWVGLERYGYLDVSQRLAYRFLYMMTTAFVDFNGVVPEKFDAVKLSHLVDAEYGNQGIDFKMVPREGFGWMNAAYQVGLHYLTTHMRRAVAACTSPEVFFRRRDPGVTDAQRAKMAAVAEPVALTLDHVDTEAIDALSPPQQ